MSDLKAHLLSRTISILGIMASEPAAGDETHGGDGVTGDQSILIRNDRMYQHKLIRFNYTTYDVRRAQDVVNPTTPHTNIMVLARDDDHTDKKHGFWYARVLGIYHMNVVYVGHGMVDYTPRRLDFLWVRWYQLETAEATGWAARKLHRLLFPPMSTDHAFGFVNPADVLRSCHIIPAFAKGRRYADTGRPGGLSGCAGDSKDWNQYYVGQ
jgi:hypothetical protein